MFHSSFLSANLWRLKIEERIWGARTRQRLQPKSWKVSRAEQSRLWTPHTNQKTRNVCECEKAFAYSARAFPPSPLMSRCDDLRKHTQALCSLLWERLTKQYDSVACDQAGAGTVLILQCWHLLSHPLSLLIVSQNFTQTPALSWTWQVVTVLIKTISGCFEGVMEIELKWTKPNKLAWWHLLFSEC